MYADELYKSREELDFEQKDLNFSRKDDFMDALFEL